MFLIVLLLLQTEGYIQCISKSFILHNGYDILDVHFTKSSIDIYAHVENLLLQHDT